MNIFEQKIIKFFLLSTILTTEVTLKIKYKQLFAENNSTLDMMSSKISIVDATTQNLMIIFRIKIYVF